MLSAFRHERDKLCKLSALANGEKLTFADKCKAFSFGTFWEQAKAVAPRLTQTLELFAPAKEDKDAPRSVSRLAMSLAILANTRNQKASLPQTIIGLSAYHAGLDKKCFQELHELGVVMHYDTVHLHLNNLATIDAHTRNTFTPTADIIFVGDNVDKEMKNRTERNGKANPKMTAVNRFVTEPRMVDDSLSKTPVTTAAETPASTYFHSQDDAYKIKEYMRAIIVDVGVDHLPEISKVFSKGELDPIVDEKLAAKTTAFFYLSSSSPKTSMTSSRS